MERTRNRHRQPATESVTTTAHLATGATHGTAVISR